MKNLTSFLCLLLMFSFLNVNVYAHEIEGTQADGDIHQMVRILDPETDEIILEMPLDEYNAEFPDTTGIRTRGLECCNNPRWQNFVREIHSYGYGTNQCIVEVYDGYKCSSCSAQYTEFVRAYIHTHN